VIQVPRFSGLDQLAAAYADGLAGGDDGSETLAQGLVALAVATARTTLVSPERPHLRRRPVLAAVGGMARPGDPAAASTRSVVIGCVIDGEKAPARGAAPLFPSIGMPPPGGGSGLRITLIEKLALVNGRSGNAVDVVR
jgi:hypothetical protein